MELNYGLFHSSYKHKKYERIEYDLMNKKSMNLTVARGEKFAFQVMLNSNKEFYCLLDMSNNLCWKGLIDRIRTELVLPEELKELFNVNLIGYVKDDSGELLSDIILKDNGTLVEAGIGQMLWVEGMVPKEFNDRELKLSLRLYYQKGYEDEVLTQTINVTINVKKVYLEPLRKSEFFLDLWQHPSNWARMYNVPVWSDTHWSIIENYIKELSTLGEKVVTAIVSDFPWAGQSCYEFPQNSSNLFEHNMITVKKKIDGSYNYNFKNLDRYIDICSKYGIDREIDLFGLMGNWNARSFGNPLKNYKDPIRINYYDENHGTFKYIKTREELKNYIKELFCHLKKEHYWDKVRVMSDEPDNAELFKEFEEFISSCSDDGIVNYKSAVNNLDFMNESENCLKDISLYLPIAIKNIKKMDKIKKELKSRSGTLTYFVCCFPNIPNNFISSPLIENRIISWLSYYMGVDGFLRWDYAIWPRDPWTEVSYKFPTWKAGDMFFVYPGKDFEPVSSLRWENLRFGIQDYEIFKMAEDKGFSREEIINKYMIKALGQKEDMKILDNKNLAMNYSFDYEVYENVKNELLDFIEKN